MIDFSTLQRFGVSNQRFIGTVSAIDTDPLGSSGMRVKVAVPTLFDGLVTDDLPWLGVQCPVGMALLPQSGDTVVVEFNGTIYEGLVVGVIQSKKGIPVANYSKHGWTVRFPNGSLLKGDDDDQFQWISSDGNKVISAKSDKIDLQTSNAVLTLGDNGDVNLQSELLTGQVKITNGQIFLEATQINIQGVSVGLGGNDLANVLTVLTPCPLTGTHTVGSLSTYASSAPGIPQIQ